MMGAKRGPHRMREWLRPLAYLGRNALTLGGAALTTSAASHDRVLGRGGPSRPPHHPYGHPPLSELRYLCAAAGVLVSQTQGVPNYVPGSFFLNAADGDYRGVVGYLGVTRTWCGVPLASGRSS
jgi:hypothetical protein